MFHAFRVHVGIILADVRSYWLSNRKPASLSIPIAM